MERRAQTWARLFTLLGHVLLKGEDFKYCGEEDGDVKEHLGTTNAFANIIDKLQEDYDAACELFPREGDANTDPALLKKAPASIFQASHLLVIQEPSSYGELEHLPLVCMFLDMCLSKDGTTQPVNASTCGHMC